MAFDWKRKTYRSRYKYITISRTLKEQNKSNDEFELMLSQLSLEDIIALKLEITSRLLKGKLYGAHLWGTLLKIVRDAVVKYAVSISESEKEMKAFLGITYYRLCSIMWHYNIDKYFGRYKKKGSIEKNKTNISKRINIV